MCRNEKCQGPFIWPIRRTGKETPRRLLTAASDPAQEKPGPSPAQRPMEPPDPFAIVPIPATRFSSRRLSLMEVRGVRISWDTRATTLATGVSCSSEEVACRVVRKKGSDSRGNQEHHDEVHAPHPGEGRGVLVHGR